MCVVLDGVEFAYPGNQPIIHSLTARFDPGEKVAVVGPSGCGKSTLLALVGGLVEPQAGTIDWFGAPAAPPCAWAFQLNYGAPRRSACDVAAIPLLGQGASAVDARSRVREVLRELGIGELAERRFGDLSGGEAQRVCIARAVLTDAPVVLLDEPTAQLDRASAGAVGRVLARARVSGRVLVVATHDPAVVESCDRVLDLAADRHDAVAP